MSHKRLLEKQWLTPKVDSLAIDMRSHVDVDPCWYDTTLSFRSTHVGYPSMIALAVTTDGRSYLVNTSQITAAHLTSSIMTALAQSGQSEIGCKIFVKYHNFVAKESRSMPSRHSRATAMLQPCAIAMYRHVLHPCYNHGTEPMVQHCDRNPSSSEHCHLALTLTLTRTLAPVRIGTSELENLFHRFLRSMEVSR